MKKEDVNGLELNKGLKLSIFENELFGDVRFVLIDGKLYAVANDILRALDYAESGWRTTISRKCKGVTKCNVLTKGGNQQMNMISQGDIYRLVGGSHLPNAEQFESWVFDTILPTLESDGMYIKGEENTKTEKELLKIAEENLERKMMRKFGKGIRRDFTDTLESNWEIKNPMQYATYTDQLINIPVLGIKSSEYKKKNELPKKSLIRDYVDDESLERIIKQEQDVATLIDFGLDYTKVKELVQNRVDRKVNLKN